LVDTEIIDLMFQMISYFRKCGKGRRHAMIINKPSNGNHGIYTSDAGGLSKIVEFGEPVPGEGSFSIIFFVSRQGENLAFQANITAGLGVTGVFTKIAGANELVADSSTVMPGSDPITFGTFSASGSGFIGLFVSDPSGLCRVIDFNDTLEGKDITQLLMGRDSYSLGRLGFRADFSDGSRGIYLAKAPRNSPTGSLPTGALFIKDHYHSAVLAGLIRFER
jgi:hypothetical protein